MTISRDIRLSVVAEVSKYVSEMAKIPGTTQKQANAAGRALAKELAKAEAQAAKDARKAALSGAKSWKDAFAGANLAGNLITAAAFKQAASAISDLIVGVVDLRNELSDVSTRTALATDTLAGLRLAARGAGLEFSALEPALAGLPKRMADAARGTGEAKVAFDELGIAVVDQAGGLRKSDEFLREFLKRLGEVESPTKRAALATQAFGESGTKLMQALGDPSALQAYIDLAVESGDVSLDGAAAADEWQRSTAELQTVIEGFKGDIFDATGATTAYSWVVLGLVAALSLTTETVTLLSSRFELFFQALDTGADGIEDLAIEIEILQQRERGLLDRVGATTKAFWDSRAAIREAAKSSGEYSAEISDATGETEKASIAQAAHAKALKQAAKEAAAYSKALTGLAGISASASDDLLSDEERIQAGLEERLVSIRRLERAALDLAKTDEEASDIIITAETARAEATAAADRERVELRREVALQLNEIEDELAVADAERVASNVVLYEDADRARVESARRAKDAIISAGVELADQALTFADDMISLAEQRNRAELAMRLEMFDGDKRAQDDAFEFAKKRAKQLHAASVLIALAKIAIDTAINTVALIPIMGPIAGPAFAIASGALAAATVIATPAPALHAGGPVDEAAADQGAVGGPLAPDEVLRRLRRSEGVLTEEGMRTVGGSDGLRRLNSGSGSMPSSIVVEQQVRHRVYDRVFYDLSRMDSLTSSKLRSGSGGGLRRVLSHAGESS